MNSTDSFQFLQPLWLLMLAPTWLLIWVYIRQARRKAAWARYCDAHLLAYMTAGQSMSRSHALPAWILGGVLSLGIFSAAAPSWSRLSHPMMEATDARIIVLDLSRSMLVQDVKPNRYAHAVAAASEILASDYAGETGLVVFAGTAFVLSPLSRDANSLQAFVEAVHPDTMPQDGSNLAQAITTAQGLLAASSGDRGQILLISSGDSHDDDALRESSAAAFAAVEQNISVSVIAIGSVAGGPMRDPKGGLTRTAEGRIQLSRPNFDLLQRVATAGKGSMMILDGVGINADLFNSGISASALATSQLLADKSAREASDDGAWLVWLMLPFALLLFRRNLLFVLLLALILQSEQKLYAADAESAAADFGDNDSGAEAIIGKGYELWTHPEKIAFNAYQRGDYDTALENTDDPLLSGASYYRSAQFQQALIKFSEIKFSEARFSEVEAASAWHNRGNALVQLQRYSEAIDSYQQAIELDPENLAAGYNKRLLELFLEQHGEAGAQGQDSDDRSVADDSTAAQEALEMHIGIATELQNNPADDQQPGPGSGADRQSSQVDPMERFDGAEMEQERFVLRAQGPGEVPEAEFINRWLSSLPETSAELYRRKFLRDFRRQQRQPR